MVGTGAYHETAATAFHDHGVTVSILNPARVRDFGKGLGLRTKTDAVDSGLLARFGLLQRPAAWQPPPAHVRKLRALQARHLALPKDSRREENRLEKAEATETPEPVHQSLRDHMAFLKRQLAELRKDIDRHIKDHPDLKEDLALPRSIPAVGPRVGGQMLCVMRSGSFHSAEQLASCPGVVPVERQSGSPVRGRARLSRAGPASIRAALYMSAIAGIRYNRHVKALYQRLLAKGKSRMAAPGAAMHKIAHPCFGVLKNKTPCVENFTPTPVGNKQIRPVS